MRFVGIIRTLGLGTKFIIAGLGLLTIICIILIVGSYNTYFRNHTYLYTATHSCRLIDTAETIYFHFLQAETCVNHSPDNSADQQHLADLYRKMQTYLTQLQDLVSGRTVQESNFQELQSLIQARSNTLLQETGMQHPANLSAFSQLTSTINVPDTLYAARVRAIIERMKQEEYRMLEDRKPGNADSSSFYFYLNLLAGTSGVVLVLLLFGLLLQDEQVTRKREKDLADLNFNKDKFFSIVSHDLRSPAINIVKLSEFLMEEDLAEDDRKLITKHLYTSSQNLRKLVENLLSWARVQMRRMEVHPATIDLHTLIQESIAQVANLAIEKQISIDNNVPTHTFVYADEQVCDMVLRNLLQNAIKFTHQLGTIKLEAAQTKDYIKLSVSDTGVGMSPDVVEKLFNLGTHFTSKGTSNEQGSGLGLILCRELVEKSNGTIEVSSQLNQGTTFTVSLPKAAPSA